MMEDLEDEISEQVAIIAKLQRRIAELEDLRDFRQKIMIAYARAGLQSGDILEETEILVAGLEKHYDIP